METGLRGLAGPAQYHADKAADAAVRPKLDMAVHGLGDSLPHPDGWREGSAGGSSIGPGTNLQIKDLGVNASPPSNGGQISQIGGANNITLQQMQRFTDTSPTGKFLDLLNAASASLFTVDITGAITAIGATITAPATLSIATTAGSLGLNGVTFTRIGSTSNPTVFNALTVQFPAATPMPLYCGGRLGLDSNYISTTDLVNQLVLNWNSGGPFGDRLLVFDSMNWNAFTSAQLSIKATDSSQVLGSISGTSVTGLTSTAQLVPGMTLTASTGTGTLAANTVISSITSATALTVNNAASVNGTLTNLTFKLPASTAFDVILVNDAGTLRLIWGPKWTTSSGAGARASAVAQQNGLWVTSGSWTTGWTNGGATVPTLTGTLLGSVFVTSTAGQLSDAGFRGSLSAPTRGVSNVFNRVPRICQVIDSTASWTYTTAAYRQSDNNSANQANIMICLPEISVNARATSMGNNTSGTNEIFDNGIGIDSTTVNSAQTHGSSSPSSQQAVQIQAVYDGYPGIGLHNVTWLEYGNTLVSFFGGTLPTQTGMEVTVWM